jgi:hypothetical protein
VITSHGIYYSQNSSAGFANIGPFKYSQITGSADIGVTIVGNDVWNPIAGWSQSLFVATPGQWYVNASMPAGNGAVVSYPDVAQFYSDPADHAKPFLLCNVTAFYSYFSEIQPYQPGVASEAAYDSWWNPMPGINEIMIQHDMVDPDNLRGDFPTIAVATFGGSNGVPVQDWNLGIFGTEIIWQLATGVVNGKGGIQEGTVDIRAMVNWLADRGYLSQPLQTTSLNSIGYGWELCSTGGRNALYRVNGFSSTYVYSPMETSPGLELSGFTITGPGPHDTVNNVVVTVTEYQSDLQSQPLSVQLWDYSGAPAQVGPTVLGNRSTSTSNVSSATFYTVTNAMLGTLRVRVYGNSAAGFTENVDAVGVTVNYTPGGAPAAPVPPVMPRTGANRAVTVPVRSGRG